MLNRIELHYSVADQTRKCLRMLPGNKGGGMITHERAIESGATYCVHVRNGLAVFDVDTPDGIHKVGELIARLERFGHKPIVFESSGGTGRIHLWVPFDTTEQYRQIEAETRATRFDKLEHRSNQRIRPPMSPPKDGKAPMRLLHPVSERDAAYRLTLGTGTRPKIQRDKVVGSIGDGIREVGSITEVPAYIVAQAKQRHKDRSLALFRIAGWCKKEGIGPNTYATLILQFPNGNGSKAREKSNPKQWLIEQVYNKAEAAEGTTNNPEDPVWNEIRQFATSVAEWKPPKQRAGGKILLLQIAEFAGKIGKTEFALSVRDAATLTGSDTKTGERRLRWAVESGFIEKVTPGTKMQAATYRLAPLHLKGTHHPTPKPSESPRGCMGECSHLMHQVLTKGFEAFHGWAMGAVVMHEIVNLGGSATAKEVADRLGRRLGSIRSILNALEGLELLEFVGGVYRLVATVDKLREVAKARHKLGVRERVFATFERHREARLLEMMRSGRPLKRSTAKEMQLRLSRKTVQESGGSCWYLSS